jgi:hypothetical protein
VRSVASSPTGETANGEQRPAWRLEGSCSISSAMPASSPKLARSSLRHAR